MPEAVLQPLNTRFIRQEDFVPSIALEGRGVTIVGCGAIGRNVALQLASIGVRKLQLIDFDTVSPTNVTTQGFLCPDVGKEKVTVLVESIHSIDPDIEVEGIVDVFRAGYKVHPIVFMCVDKIDTRGVIWRTIKDKAELIIDGRMLGECMQVLAINTDDQKDYYPTTLFKKEDQHPERCTGHATIYCATIAAGLMVHQFTRFLRNFPLETHSSFSLLTGEMVSLAG